MRRTRVLTDKERLILGEKGYFKALLDLYPTGILSVVSDTFDLWRVCTEYLPALKEQVLARDGKLVIRPDSGDPVDIICGTELGYDDPNAPWNWRDVDRTGESSPSEKGVIELLWDVFDGTISDQGYKVLDPHIGAIYGDSITLERAEEICERLKAKGFASTNIVFGIGSYTYQMNTRDTFGFAMKATYGEVTTEQWVGNAGMTVTEYREIFKDPITDDGTKRSAKGLLQVMNNRPDAQGNDLFWDGKDDLKLIDQVTKDQEKGGLLETVFLDGKLVRTEKLSTIRERLNSQL